MKASHQLKLLSLVIIFIAIAVFWNDAWVQPMKLIVVFLHEAFHALGALLTGGKVESICILWDESGYTVTRGGNFLTIAISGYLGCIFLGSMMLSVSLSGKYCEYHSITLGILISLFLLYFASNIESKIYFLILAWALFLIITGILLPKISRYSLFYMGGVTSLYAFFDLFDFFRGGISETDAGKIADHYVHDPFLSKIMAYVIGCLISVISVWILYRIIVKALSPSKKEEPALTKEDHLFNETNPACIDQQLIARFQEIVRNQAEG